MEMDLRDIKETESLTLNVNCIRGLREWEEGT